MPKLMEDKQVVKSCQVVADLSEILKNELIMSMGCTEPSAIAYATSYAKEKLPGKENIVKVTVTLSSNMLKNALCVSLPNTELNGIESIVLLALVKGESKNKLTIFHYYSPK